MYDDQSIWADETGLALVDERGVNDGALPSLIILPDGADADEQLYLIRRSDSRYTVAHTTSLVAIIVILVVVVMEVMVGAPVLSSIDSRLPLAVSLAAMIAAAGFIVRARLRRPQDLLRADISLRDILTPENVSRLRKAKSSERKEDYLDLQEQIAVKHGRRLGFDPQNKVVD